MRGREGSVRAAGGVVLAAAAVVWLGGLPAARADGAPAAVMANGPYLTELSEASVDVRFELSTPSAASIELRDDGTPDGRARAFADATATTMHVVAATGLSPAKGYAYTVRVRGKVVGEGHFTTLPAPGTSPAPVRFVVYGDDRSDADAHAAVVHAIAASPSDFLVNTGDLVADGGLAEDWRSFFRIEAPLLRDRALFVSIGNHELYDDRAGANFARYFGFARPGEVARTYGTVRAGGTRFFFLNAMHDWSGGEEREWLERELARADAEPGLLWRIAVTHHGPWSAGPHGPNTALLAAHVPELLAAHHVDLLVSGHDHIYERGVGEGMKYLVSGGGGAPLYPIKPTPTTRKAEAVYHFVEVSAGADAVRIVARRVDGSVIDQCGFRKGTDWDCDPPPAARPAAGVDAGSIKAEVVPPRPPQTASAIAQRGCSTAAGSPGHAGGAWSVGLGVTLAALWRRRGMGRLKRLCVRVGS
ncbi:MAG TPA: metallophosphoesterase [Polyangiaceae bacterium]|jgi:hypothetical protein